LRNHTFFVAPFLAGVAFFVAVDGFLAATVFLVVVVFFTGVFFATEVYFLVGAVDLVVVFGVVVALDVLPSRLVGVFLAAEGFVTAALGLVATGLPVVDLLEVGLVFLKKEVNKQGRFKYNKDRPLWRRQYGPLELI
jgi:hypothetical protein